MTTNTDGINDVIAAIDEILETPQARLTDAVVFAVATAVDAGVSEVEIQRILRGCARLDEIRSAVSHKEMMEEINRDKHGGLPLGPAK